MWNPSIEHKIAHEIGHAQLMRYYQISVVKMEFNKEPYGICKTYSDPNWANDLAHLYITAVGVWYAHDRPEGYTLQRTKPIEEQFQKEIDILLAGEIAGHLADSIPDDTRIKADAWISNPKMMDPANVETLMACDAANYFLDVGRSNAAQFVKESHDRAELIINQALSKMAALHSKIQERIEQSQANRVVIEGALIHQNLG